VKRCEHPGDKSSTAAAGVISAGSVLSGKHAAKLDEMQQY